MAQFIYTTHPGIEAIAWEEIQTLCKEPQQKPSAKKTPSQPAKGTSFSELPSPASNSSSQPKKRVACKEMFSGGILLECSVEDAAMLALHSHCLHELAWYGAMVPIPKNLHLPTDTANQVNEKNDGLETPGQTQQHEPQQQTPSRPLAGNLNTPEYTREAKEKKKALQQELQAICSNPAIKELFIKAANHALSQFPFLKKSFTFRLSGSQALQTGFGEAMQTVLTRAGYHAKVQLKDPEYEFMLLLSPTNALLLGIRIPFDFSKRWYRIHTSHNSIKASVATAMLMIQKKKSVVLDPTLYDSVLLIEQALMQKRQVRLHESPFIEQMLHRYGIYEKKMPPVPEPCTLIGYTDSFGALAKAKANAKIAGVLKEMTLSKIDLSWVDYKLGPQSVDLLVSMLVQPTSSHQDQAIKKMLYQLFYQASYLLTAHGSIVLYTNQKTLQYAKQYAPLKQCFTVYEGFCVAQFLRPDAKAFASQEQKQENKE
ncbi:MAG: hypothetical protein QW594_04230 [Candidatus Woesearchaeota archaeon]